MASGSDGAQNAPFLTGGQSSGSAAAEKLPQKFLEFSLTAALGRWRSRAATTDLKRFPDAVDRLLDGRLVETARSSRRVERITAAARTACAGERIIRRAAARLTPTPQKAAKNVPEKAASVAATPAGWFATRRRPGRLAARQHLSEQIAKSAAESAASPATALARRAAAQNLSKDLA